MSTDDNEPEQHHHDVDDRKSSADIKPTNGTEEEEIDRGNDEADNEKNATSHELVIEDPSNSDQGEERTVIDEGSTAMQLPLTTTVETKPGQQQHSPGSSSSSSSITTAPRPSPRPSSTSRKTAEATSEAVANVVASTATMTTPSSLPPSAVSAPPYVPSSHLMMATAAVATNPIMPPDFVPAFVPDIPPPFMASPVGPVAPGAIYYNPVGPFPMPDTAYMCGPPLAPGVGVAVAPTAAPPNGGRFTPSPTNHSVSGSSSPSSFCQQHQSNANSVVSSGNSNGNVAITTTAANTTTAGPQHVVNYHVHQGEVLSLQLGDGNVKVIAGPADVRLISTSSTPPLPMPLQVPPGHLVQQVVDQNGTLTHVILSQDPSCQPMPAYLPTSQPPPPLPMPTTTTNSSVVSNSSSNNTNNGSGATSGYASTPTSNGASPVHQQPGCSSASGASLPPSHPPLPPPTAVSSASATVQYGPPPFVGRTTAASTTLPPPVLTPPQLGFSQHPPGYPTIMGGNPRARDPTHERLIKKAKSRQQQQHGHSMQAMTAAAASSTHSTPTTSPAKRNAQPTKGAGGRRCGAAKATLPVAAMPPNLPSTGLVLTSSGLASGSLVQVGRHVVRLPPGGSIVTRYATPPPPNATAQLVTDAKDASSFRPLHGVRGTRVGKKGNDGSRLDDSEESGVGAEEEEEVQQLLLELLSNIRTPRVSQIESRSALLQWGPPLRDSVVNAKFDSLEPIPESQFKYEVLLSDKGRDGKYRSIFTGDSVDCKLTDLRPHTEYHIRIHALLESLRGGASDTVSFLTPACEPDQPSPPKMIARSKTSINLRWNAPNDNGSHIQMYVLEHELQGVVSECYKGRAKNYNVAKLNPATSYRFRLYALNECGRSRSSEWHSFATQGSPPSAPEPPGLETANSQSLQLVWAKRVSDDSFVLQMDDRNTGHGYLNCYSGPEMRHLVTGLKRNTGFKFRLAAMNEEGRSPWSDEVVLTTMPDAPSPPLRPASKGRIHATSFKVRWDPPADNGGAPVETYLLEIDDGNHGWKTVYQGKELETICDHLSPGKQYSLRVACTGIGNSMSGYSEVCHISTEPVVPGPCAPPRSHGRPKANSLSLRWGWPDYDGGSAVTEFDVEVNNDNGEDDNKQRVVYKGRDTECVVAGLRPGRRYLFQVRAHNRAGAGPWSEALELMSGAGVPDAPEPLRVDRNISSLISLKWPKPSDNGASIQEYTLQASLLSSTLVTLKRPQRLRNLERESADDEDEADDSNREPPENEDDDDDDEDDDDESDVFEDDEEEEEEEMQGPLEAATTELSTTEVTQPEFITLYVGANNGFETKTLKAKSRYQFRVCAINNAGKSNWSKLLECESEATSPEVVTGLQLVSSTATSLTLSWEEPENNGSLVKSFNIECKGVVKRVENDSLEWWVDEERQKCVLSYTITDLKADTAHSIRVQAENSIGPGPYSSLMRASTRPFPPAPPRLECVSMAHNSIKLKWGEPKHNNMNSDSNNNSNLSFILDMERTKNQFQTVYNGVSLSHRLGRLNENTRYVFRVCARNEAGRGPYSATAEFVTPFAHPPKMQPPRVSSVTSDSCLVEWSAPRNSSQLGELDYRVSLHRSNNSNTLLKHKNTGQETQWRIAGLEAKCDYSVKVLAIRRIEGRMLEGPASAPTDFSTLKNDNSDAKKANNANNVNNSSSGGSSLMPSVRDVKSWSDQKWAMVILVGFTLFAVLLAFVVQQLLK